MYRSMKQLKSDICDISIRLNTIVKNEKIEEDAKDKIEAVATQLYYLSTKKDLIAEEFENEEQKEVAEKGVLKNACEGASNDIDLAVQTYQIEGKEAELLEDLSAALDGIVREIEPKPFPRGKNMTLDQFFESKPRNAKLDDFFEITESPKAEPAAPDNK